MSTPDTIGGYRVVRALSRGGMGEVYIAENAGAGGFSKKIALKLMRPEHQENAEHKKMFFAEAKLAARLDHPNICQVFDFGEDRGNLYLAMELLDGASLAQLMRHPSGGHPVAMPPRLVASIIAQAARGLAHAHELRDEEGRALNVVHRDVSPHNIFVTRTGAAKVLDFGIAKTAETSTMTEMGVIKGKAGYLAPEQVLNEPLDARTDVFQLGTCLWEALAGEPLFLRANVYACARAVMEDAVPDLRALQPEVPEAMVAVAEAALRKDKAARTAATMEIARGLEAALAGAAPTPSELGAFVDAWLADKPDAPPPAELTGPAAGRPTGQATVAATPPPALPPEAETSSSQLLTPDTTATDALEVPRPFWQRRAVLLGALAVAGSAGLGAIARSAMRPDAEPPVLGSEPAPDAPVVVDAGPPAPVVDAGVRTEPAPSPVPSPARRRRRRRRRAEPAPVKKPDIEPKPDPEPVGTGRLEVRAHPVAHVTVDGASWGNTPVRPREVSAGKHRVRVVEVGSGEVRFDGVVEVQAGKKRVVNPNKR